MVASRTHPHHSTQNSSPSQKQKENDRRHDSVSGRVSDDDYGGKGQESIIIFNDSDIIEEDLKRQRRDSKKCSRIAPTVISMKKLRFLMLT